MAGSAKTPRPTRRVAGSRRAGRASAPPPPEHPVLAALAAAGVAPESVELVQIQQGSIEAEQESDESEGSALDIGAVLRIREVGRALIEGAGEDPDAETRATLAKAHQRQIRALRSHLPESLGAEIAALSVPLNSRASLGEIKLANAQLAGWLGELVDQVRMSVMSNQGGGPGMLFAGRGGAESEIDNAHTGQYL